MLKDPPKQYKVVLLSGGFDPVHRGHVEMIEAARDIADEVWIILNNDIWLEDKKGKRFMKQSERQYIMSQFKGVKETFICQPRVARDKTVCDGIYSAINLYRRKFDGEELSMAFGNGGDRTKGNTPEEEYCNTMEVDMVWNLGKKVQSSSWLLEKFANAAV